MSETRSGTQSGVDRRNGSYGKPGSGLGAPSLLSGICVLGCRATSGTAWEPGKASRTGALPRFYFVGWARRGRHG